MSSPSTKPSCPRFADSQAAGGLWFVSRGTRTYSAAMRTLRGYALLPALLLCSPARGQELDTLRDAALQSVGEQASALTELSDAVWRYAELSLEEVRSADALADYLEGHGFRVDRGVAGMPTAFVASFGSGRPILGILGEYDALPGINNAAEPRKVATEQGAPGHGCGHNLFGAASAGAAVAAKAVLEAHDLPGTLVYFGCPAEETGIGKVFMARDGLFDDLDVCLDWHPGDRTGVDFSGTLALNSFEVEFRGKTAHGAADPWNGRSALDAVELMNHAVNLMREHVSPTTRIHYVIPEGGGAPNVVPDYAKVWYFVRDLTRQGVESTYVRILKAAHGAAIATETEQEVHLLTGVHSYLLNRPLSELLDRAMRYAGPPQWSDDEHAFAREIQRATQKPPAGMFEGITQLPENEITANRGSTDVAEISRICPTAKLRVASSPIQAPWHAWPVVACGGMSIGHKAMLCAARTLSVAAVELLVSPDVVEAARAEFEAKTLGREYVSPIPAHRQPPIPTGK